MYYQNFNITALFIVFFSIAISVEGEMDLIIIIDNSEQTRKADPAD